MIDFIFGFSLPGRLPGGWWAHARIWAGSRGMILGGRLVGFHVGISINWSKT